MILIFFLFSLFFYKKRKKEKEIYMSYKLKKANDGKHKYIFETPTGKKIKFGAIGYQDYTMHKNKERKKNYISRHSARENWNKINAGTLARFILWNKPTIKESVNNFEKKFNIKISY